MSDHATRSNASQRQIARGNSTGPDSDQSSLSSRLAEDIKDLLVEGILQPGQHVSASALAQQYGVSHIPVREALGRLEAEGYLTRKKNAGFLVPPLSLSVVEDVYTWRKVIEHGAYERAVPQLQDKDLVQLAELSRRMRDQVDANNGVTFHRLNHEFHFLALNAMGSEQLLRILTPLWDAASHFQAVLIRQGGLLSVLQDQHEMILTALERRDVRTVLDLTDEHRDTTLTLMRESLMK
jgi:DNA-binding GntR family transcriptional regulator